jgi:hypothetical protein
VCRVCGRWCSSTPQNYHPDQPAPHTAFQTHCALGQAGEQYDIAFLRALGAHFHQPHPPLLRPYPPGGRAARGSHTGQFSCFGPRSCFIAPILDIYPTGFDRWTGPLGEGREPTRAKRETVPGAERVPRRPAWAHGKHWAAAGPKNKTKAELGSCGCGCGLWVTYTRRPNPKLGKNG